MSKLQKFDLFKGHNSKMVNAIQLDIKLDQKCMSVNNFGKYGDDPIQVQRADKDKMYDID